ncbi:hypothetical protein VTN02DRAFT_2970 [Thermoascus thermophilus]
MESDWCPLDQWDGVTPGHPLSRGLVKRGRGRGRCSPRSGDDGGGIHAEGPQAPTCLLHACLVHMHHLRDISRPQRCVSRTRAKRTIYLGSVRSPHSSPTFISVTVTLRAIVGTWTISPRPLLFFQKDPSESRPWTAYDGPKRSIQSIHRRPAPLLIIPHGFCDRHVALHSVGRERNGRRVSTAVY